MNLQIIFLLIVLTNLQRQTKQKTNTKHNKILTCGGSVGGGEQGDPKIVPIYM